MKNDAKPSAWWEAPEGERFASVFRFASAMRRQHDMRRADNRVLRALYQAKGYASSVHGDFISLDPMADAGSLFYNVIRTAVDTLLARVATTKPKPTFSTTGGTWAQQRRAKRLDRYVYGAMHAAKFYQTAAIVFRDAALTDLGAVKGCVEGGRIVLQRVDTNDVFVDYADAYYGQPSTVLHSYVMPRDKAHAIVDAWNPDASEDERARLHALVDKAQASADFTLNIRRVSSFGDVVEVNEVWKLPSGPDADDGRHVLSLSTVDLADEPCDFLPFAFMGLLEPFDGFYRQGIGELLVPHQRAINVQLERMAEIIRKMSLSRYFVQRGANLNLRYVQDAEDAVIIEGDAPPQIMAGNAIPSEHWRWLEWLIRAALEQVGLNEGAVAARKPAGLDSGAALREYNDHQSERLSPYFQAFDNFVRDVGALVVNLSRQAEECGHVLKANAPMGRGYAEIDWKAAAMDEGTYTLQVFSTSSLPTRPEARRQQVEEYFRTGQIDSAEYRRLLEIPDTDAANDAALAARDVVDSTLERFLDGDDDEGVEDLYVSPEPFDDLAYAKERGMTVYHQARLAGAPEGRLELVRRYVLAAERLQRQQAQPQGPTPEQLTQTAPQLQSA